jgi:glucose-6-phosphate dehydrogenase assembly protein OpcA
MEADLNAHAASATDVAAILDELGRSKTEAAGAGREGCGSVATMNFIVYVDDATHRQWVLERAVRIAGKHPSRLIVIDATSAGGGADVAASTRDASGTTVLCERIDLSVGGLDHVTIAGVAHDLCLPGINTVLWWTSADVDQNDTFAALMELATHIVLDSSGSGEGADAIRELAAFHRSRPDVALRDLAFMRLAPWQDMIAQFFDDPALFADVFSITRLEVDAGSDAEALYIAGWLGSRLSWTVCDSRSFCARDGRVVPLVRQTRGERRRVVRVALTSLDSTYSAELSDDEGVVRLTVGGAKAKPARYAPLQSIDNASLIERAMLDVGPDYVFETSLETVGALLA